MQDVTSTKVGPLSYDQPGGRRTKLGVLGWVVAIVVIGGMAISILLPSLCRAREPANRVKCASNLREIGLAIMQYAQENGGQYPPSLAVLTRQGQILPAVMVCPSSNDEAVSGADTAVVFVDLNAMETNAPGHKHCLSYVYAGGRLTATTALATTIVAYEPLDNHDGKGTNVLFGDGSVKWIDKATWPKMAADAGVAVVPSMAGRP